MINYSRHRDTPLKTGNSTGGDPLASLVTFTPKQDLHEAVRNIKQDPLSSEEQVVSHHDACCAGAADLRHGPRKVALGLRGYKAPMGLQVAPGTCPGHAVIKSGSEDSECGSHRHGVEEDGSRWASASRHCA
jgi:hypothetical protein